MRVEQHTLTLDGSPVSYRTAPSTGPTPVYLHTAPTTSEDWEPLLERTGGVAPDLMGFGRSGKGGHLDYTPAGLARAVGALLAELEIGRMSLAGHGWGAAVAAILAARWPERVSRLVLIDAAPPLNQALWHRHARWWRTPVLGELVMGSITRAWLARMLRRASVQPAGWPDARVRAVWEQFDQGTQRATLRLHRWASPPRTDELAQTLGAIRVPTTVIWGAEDPWFPPELALGWTQRLPDASFDLVEGAGHWPWLDRPEVLEKLTQMMAGP